MRISLRFSRPIWNPYDSTFHIIAQRNCDVVSLKYPTFIRWHHNRRKSEFDVGATFEFCRLAVIQSLQRPHLVLKNTFFKLLHVFKWHNSECVLQQLFKYHTRVCSYTRFEHPNQNKWWYLFYYIYYI